MLPVHPVGISTRHSFTTYVDYENWSCSELPFIPLLLDNFVGLAVTWQVSVVFLQERLWSRGWRRRGGWTWVRTGRRTNIAPLTPSWGTSTGWHATLIITAPDVPTSAAPATTTLVTTSVRQPGTACVYPDGKATTVLNVSILNMLIVVLAECFYIKVTRKWLSSHIL